VVKNIDGPRLLGRRGAIVFLYAITPVSGFGAKIVPKATMRAYSVDSIEGRRVIFGDVKRSDRHAHL
jgi:hypothetical protein